MRSVLGVLCLTLLLAACSTKPVSEQEQAYLARTNGFVDAGSYPVASQIFGSDGYKLEFVPGPQWQGNAEVKITVKNLAGAWMPFYAGDSGSVMVYYPQSCPLTATPGKLKKLFIIASPEDSIAQIIVDNGKAQASLYSAGDSITPFSPVNGANPRPAMPARGGSFHQQDSAQKGSLINPHQK